MAFWFMRPKRPRPRDLERSAESHGELKRYKQASLYGGTVTNVIVQNPSNGDVLTFNASTDVWNNAQPSSTFGGIFTDSSLQGNGLAVNPVGLVSQLSVTPGFYPAANITVNGRGVITNIAASGAITSVLTDSSLEGTGLSGDPLKIALQGGVVPNTYTYTTVTVNSEGIITAIANGAPPVTSVVTDSSLSGSGSVASPLKVATQAGITPGSYTYASVTVNGDGIITAISSGAVPLTSVTTDSSLTGLGTGASPLKVATQAGVTAGSYILAAVTVNADGIITAVSSGTVSVDGTTIGGNGTSGSALHWLGGLADGTFLTGNGLSGTPFTLNHVNSDNVTLQGNGTSTALAIKAVQVDGTTITGNGNTTPLSAVASSVHTDGTTIGGNGGTGGTNPLHWLGGLSDGTFITGNGLSGSPFTLQAVAVDRQTMTGLGTLASPIAWIGCTDIFVASVTTVNATAATLATIALNLATPGTSYHMSYHAVAASNSGSGGTASFTNDVLYDSTQPPGSANRAGGGTQIVLPSATLWRLNDAASSSAAVFTAQGSSGFTVEWTIWVQIFAVQS